MSLVLHLFLFTSLIFTQLIAKEQDPLPHSKNPNQCTSKCGSFQIPFPFYLNATSCPTLSDAFRLSCVNSSSLFLNIASESYRILQFFPDGVLVDFPNTSVCRQYNDLKSFSFSGNEYFGISTDNVLDLYDCEDSSLCKADCEKTSLMPGCAGQAGGYPSCCYPLSDRSAWRPGDSLSEFSQFGCRGFSSWIVLPGSRIGKRGVKLEWAVPRNSTEATCAADADVLNATSVTAGIRCQCPDGFYGDGFPVGSGCLKSCFKDGKEVRGLDCYRRNNHGRKKTIVLAVVIISALTVVCLTALCLLKRPIRSDKFVSDQSRCQSAILSQKACRSRLFTYHELEEATNGFEDGQKIVDGAKTALYAGVLIGGSHVAVQKIQCESERDLIRVLFKVETLSALSHRNLARIIGWSIDSGYTPLVVYEYPQNGTFKQHLIRARDQKIPLDWYRRLNVAAETACVLAFLHHEISPPIFHHDLQSGCIFLDADFSVKLAGFELHNADHEEVYRPSEVFEGSHCRKNDVYSLGVVLLEIITGNTIVNFSTTALQKIKNGKLEEIVDPSLYYHEQPPFRREQIEIIADLATRCLLFGADGKLGMADVARELVHITKDSVDGSSRRGPALEETFSNSSLLQMISMSPDSIYLP
ncbi:putative inactive receptor-like protein kinase [Sesamum alatum]|uniref:Inactive receptor-like protein kinase n=1 Tax=Sesamum alatum TaxID=300844 RepID=A0AAE2CBE6_9LAMI|nr:putative inactive receptor-like protein kinase [Sesamum alatum]